MTELDKSLNFNSTMNLNLPNSLSYFFGFYALKRSNGETSFAVIGKLVRVDQKQKKNRRRNKVFGSKCRKVERREIVVSCSSHII